jgi:hypothetical protein
MSDATPGPDLTPEPKPKPNVLRIVMKMWTDGGSERTRLVIWVVLVGFGLYLIGTGVVGIITKSQ